MSSNAQASCSSTAPFPAQSRSASASWAASGCPQPTLTTTSAPAAVRAGATHETIPPGWYGSPTSRSQRSTTSATVSRQPGQPVPPLLRTVLRHRRDERLGTGSSVMHASSCVGGEPRIDERATKGTIQAPVACAFRRSPTISPASSAGNLLGPASRSGPASRRTGRETSRRSRSANRPRPTESTSCPKATSPTDSRATSVPRCAASPCTPPRRRAASPRAPRWSTGSRWCAPTPGASTCSSTSATGGSSTSTSA